MSKPCTAILIDPTEATVREVDYDGNIDTIYRLLSSPWHKVDTFTCIHLDDGDALYIDDNGLLHEPMVPYWFKVDGYAQPLAGRGLIMGTDDEGDSISPKITTKRVIEKVTNLARFGERLIGVKDTHAYAYAVPTPHAELIFPYPVPKKDQN